MKRLRLFTARLRFFWWWAVRPIVRAFLRGDRIVQVERDWDVVDTTKPGDRFVSMRRGDRYRITVEFQRPGGA